MEPTGEAAALFDLVRTLELPSDDYVIFGSGPLIARGIIEPANDLDLLAGPRAWDIARRSGRVIHLDQWDVDVVSCADGVITVGRQWAIGEVDVDALIADAEIINGLPFAPLQHVIAYKRIARRPKDIAHLALIEEYLASR